MIAGFAVTAARRRARCSTRSRPARLVAVTASVAGAIALLLAAAAVRGLEGASVDAAAARHARRRGSARALAEVWAEPQARRFAVFVFVVDARLQRAGTGAGAVRRRRVRVLARPVHRADRPAARGRAGGHAAGRRARQPGGRRRGVTLRRWTVGGCLASAAGLLLLALAGLSGPLSLLTGRCGPAWSLLGVANGAFAVVAIGAMMGLPAGRPGRARRPAHGAVGRGAGRRLRRRRAGRHAGQRLLARRSARLAGRPTPRCSRRGGAVPVAAAQARASSAADVPGAGPRRA